MPTSNTQRDHVSAPAQDELERKPKPARLEASPETNLEQHLLELAQLAGQLSLSAKTDASSAARAGCNEVSEEALPTMQARYRVLVEQIPAIVFMAFLDGGLSEAYVSPHIENLLGFSREEWLDDPVRWYQQIHPDDRQRWSIEAAEILIGGRSLKSVYRVLARDGRVVWFHCEAKLVRRKDGQPWFVHGVAVDITELKETEQRLQQAMAERERLQKLELERQIARTEQSESRLAAIVESSEDAIMAKSLEGEITDWNAAARRLLGYESGEIVGKSVLVLVPAELHGQEMEILCKLRRGERIDRQETERLTKDGRRLQVSLTVSPIKDAAGNVIGASSIIRDITARKQEEEKLRVAEKLATAGRLAATIAHEVNNPLAAVTNLVYLARTSANTEMTGRFLEQAEQELARVAHLTKQTLGFYRETSGATLTTVGSLLPGLVTVFSTKTRNKNVEVQSEVRDDPSVFILAGEIRQVLANILSNSIDAVDNGGRIRIRVSMATRRVTRGPGVLITIADSGSGIPPAIRSQIFEPFFTTKKDVGTGLGLWVCKNIVEKHGGKIRFKSSVRPNKSWTAFSIFLPLDSSVVPLEQQIASIR